VITDDSSQHHQFDDEEMQEFLINQAGVEGVLYHTEMSKIKIIYNTHNGVVKLVDAEEKQDINSDYTSAYEAQRKQVEIGIRRLAKVELLVELFKLNDEGICDVIKKNHVIDSVTGKIRSNTSEIALDMTLVQVIKLGYSNDEGGFSLGRFLFKFMKKNQTKTQRAVYAAFQDFKQECEGSSYFLGHLKSKSAIEQFKGHINKHLK
jgi:hypothetical protein